jgi:hypothetical protein
MTDNDASPKVMRFVIKGGRSMMTCPLAYGRCRQPALADAKKREGREKTRKWRFSHLNHS